VSRVRVSRIRRLRVARILLACVSVAVLASGCGYGIGTASDNTKGISQAKAFHRGLALFPQGKRLYWLGPKADGFRLGSAADPTGGLGTGVTLAYVRDHVSVYVITSVNSEAPPASTVSPSGGVQIGMTMAPSGQIVEFKILPETPRPSAATLAKLKAALRPVTSADIDRLPADWSAIP
jgi:hypothetical protein